MDSLKGAANAPFGVPGIWVVHVLDTAIGSIVIGKPFSWDDSTVSSMYFPHSHVFLLSFASWNMSPHRCLRPTILPAAHHLPPFRHRLLWSPIIHQHHHMRTIATLRPPYKSQSYSFPSRLTIAAASFGAAWWLLPQRSANATKTASSDEFRAYVHDLQKRIDSELRKAWHEYLGCQNIRFEPPQQIASDLWIGFTWDGDVTSEDVKGKVLGVCLNTNGGDEMKMVVLLLDLLGNWDKEGVLRRQGKAVCILSCRGVMGIWVYGEVGVEVEGADCRVWGTEGGCLSRIVRLT